MMKKIYFLLAILVTTSFCEDSITMKQLINQAELEWQSNNLVKAKNLLIQACEAGSAVGCNYMGNALIQQRNGTEALWYVSRACDLGSAQGCYNVGYINEKGIHGVKQDINTAIHAYNKACDSKDAEGCYKLGDLFYEGKYGIPSDNTKANTFYAKARQFGFRGGWLDREKEENEREIAEAKFKKFREKDSINAGFKGSDDPKYIEYQEELGKKYEEELRKKYIESRKGTQ